MSLYGVDPLGDHSFLDSVAENSGDVNTLPESQGGSSLPSMVEVQGAAEAGLIESDLLLLDSDSLGSREGVVILPSVTSSNQNEDIYASWERSQQPEAGQPLARNDQEGDLPLSPENLGRTLPSTSIMSLSTEESHYTSSFPSPFVIDADDASSNSSSGSENDDLHSTLVLSVPSTVPSALTVATPRKAQFATSHAVAPSMTPSNLRAIRDVSQQWHEQLESEADWEKFREEARNVLAALGKEDADSDEVLAWLIQQEEDYFSSKDNAEKPPTSMVVLRDIGRVLATFVLPVLGAVFLGHRAWLLRRR